MNGFCYPFLFFQTYSYLGEGECHVAAKYHVTAMTKSWPQLVGDGWQWLAMVGNGWQWLAMVGNVSE